MKQSSKVIAGTAVVVPMLATVVLSRGRIVKLIRAVQSDISRRNLNVKYHVLSSQVDGLAELQSIMFFDRHRTYFNKRAEFYYRDVRDRGPSLLNMRKICESAFLVMMLREITHQHAKELIKVNPRRGQKLFVFAKQLDLQAELLFAQMNAADFPVDLIIEEYQAVS